MKMLYLLMFLSSLEALGEVMKPLPQSAQTLLKQITLVSVRGALTLIPTEGVERPLSRSERMDLLLAHT